MEFSHTHQAALDLPLPKLVEGRFASITAHTDEALFEATGVRIAFTQRHGGASVGSFDSLNLGHHVHDDLEAVMANRRIVLDALGCAQATLVVPNQVHGDHVIELGAEEDASALLERAANDPCVLDADAVSVHAANVAALLNFADCVPVIAVAPTGDFSVIHAGWRGVDNCIAAKAVQALAARADIPASSINVYVGPHIHGECFETSEEIHDAFVAKFGESCSLDSRHVILVRALRTQLEAIGVAPERIVDMDVCTVCHNDDYFSYRAQDGVCGRHAAFAARPLDPKEA